MGVAMHMLAYSDKEPRPQPERPAAVSATLGTCAATLRISISVEVGADNAGSKTYTEVRIVRHLHGADALDRMLARHCRLGRVWASFGECQLRVAAFRVSA